MYVSQDIAECIARAAHDQGKILVFTNGCFDILHLGHVTYLESAKKLGDILIVGVNSDASVQRLKGTTRPIIPAPDRARLISALRAVDYTCIFEEDTPLRLIHRLQPDVLVKGGDYTPNTIIGADVVQARGGRVVVLPFLQGQSTTRIIERICTVYSISVPPYHKQ
ncbi:MAG: D-glycero-beta-D-manno-heptose 1-phosphate adenylyltransferase [Bacteroidota bacterium]|nr:D-glycero-beta-D-manno-heptose 1-phosphate adenylyltransferase [Candidatus Kapabacteria bacterium]MDW8220636.1 D-glycero-beta-D-manno-heptose 1-phosphate adenylyltransferase [Bacteroidota bacterium]